MILGPISFRVAGMCSTYSDHATSSTSKQIGRHYRQEQQIFVFFKRIHNGSELHTASYSVAGLEGGGVKLTTYLYLASWLRINTAVNSTFMKCAGTILNISDSYLLLAYKISITFVVLESKPRQAHKMYLLFCQCVNSYLRRTIGIYSF